MDGMIVFVCYAAIMFAVCMVGAYVPQVRRFDDRQRHALIALSAGIFLALLFLLLIPETIELNEANHDHEGLAYAMLAGFLVIAFIDVLIKHFHMRSCPCECHQDQHKHELVSISAFIGLSVHACCDGLALAAALMGGEEVGIVALTGMCIHKFVETFSLSSSMLLSGEEARVKWVYLTGFSLITPLMGLLFYLFLSEFDVESVAGLPIAFATGTFMFVTFCNMLPEAFHRKDDELRSFGIVMVGVIVSAAALILASVLGGHVH